MAKKGSEAPLKADQVAALEALAKGMKAKQAAAVKEAAKMKWGEEIRQRYYKPKKRLISLRVEEDVLAWLQHGGKGYQTRANQVLRERMLAEVEGRK